MYDFVIQEKYKISSNHEFISRYNVSQLVEMLFCASSKQIMDFRGALFAVYRYADKADFVEADVNTMREILELVQQKINSNDYQKYVIDKIQLKQLDWLCDNEMSRVDYVFEHGKFTEAELEKAIIELFEQQGYDYVQGKAIHRKYDDILLLEDLKTYISSRYESESVSDTEMQKIINKIALVSSIPLYNGNKETFWLVNEGFDLERDDMDKVALHIDYIDYEHPKNNIFKVVNQYSIQDVHLRRPDLLIFINGIPIGICEFKTAIEEDTTIYEAWEQITVIFQS